MYSGLAISRHFRTPLSPLLKKRVTRSPCSSPGNRGGGGEGWREEDFGWKLSCKRLRAIIVRFKSSFQKHTTWNFPSMLSANHLWNRKRGSSLETDKYCMQQRSSKRSGNDRTHLEGLIFTKNVHPKFVLCIWYSFEVLGKRVDECIREHESILHCWKPFALNCLRIL